MSISRRTSNAERSRTTQHALIRAAREAFVEHGYDGTSTPAVATGARMTRGALYHHYADKRALFRAVIESEGAAIGEAVERATVGLDDARAALLAGSVAYLDAMTAPGRCRLLLVDAPAVLGRLEAEGFDTSVDALRAGLRAVAGIHDADVVATLLSAAFDRAALEIASGGNAEAIRASMLWLVHRVIDDGSAR